MTTAGGTNNDGLIFKLDTNNNAETSINEISLTKGSVNVYPNPGIGIYTIQSPVESGQLSIEIYNMLGEEVYLSQYPMQNTPYQIDLRSQPSGVYLYRIIENSEELIGEGKLIIQK
jgi:hypothetical protein